MQLPVGIYAYLAEDYSCEDCKFIETIKFKLDAWCNEAGREYLAKNGLVWQRNALIDIPEAEGTSRESVVAGMVLGLRAKRTEIQADAQKQITEIDSKINNLFAIEHNPTAKESSFAPRAQPPYASDLDDIPF